MTPEQFSVIAGILLAVGFEYIPGLKSWFANKPSQTKALVMLGLLLAVGVGSVALSCYGPFEFFECSEAGIWDAVEAFAMAAAANQSTYLLTKKYV